MYIEIYVGSKRVTPHPHFDWTLISPLIRNLSLPSFAMHCTARWKIRNVATGSLPTFQPTFFNKKCGFEATQLIESMEVPCENMAVWRFALYSRRFPIHGTSKSSMVLSDFPWNHPAMGVPPCLWKPPRFEILNWWGWPMEYPKLRDRNGFLWELRENPQISWFNIVLHLSVHLPAFHGHKWTWNSIF